MGVVSTQQLWSANKTTIENNGRTFLNFALENKMPSENRVAVHQNRGWHFLFSHYLSVCPMKLGTNYLPDRPAFTPKQAFLHPCRRKADSATSMVDISRKPRLKSKQLHSLQRPQVINPLT